MFKRSAISLTHVEYEQGDKLGYILAWCSLFPIFLLVSFITLVAVRRDLTTIFFFLGLLVNEGCNFTLKHIIKEPRPTSDLYQSNLFVEYGMPSSHAQFMSFFATYFTLVVFIRTSLSEGSMDVLMKMVLSCGTIGGAMLCSISRYYLGYHTTSQIVYGIIIGLIIALIWFSFIQLVVSPYYPLIYFWRINDYLMLKDFSLIPNCLWYEFTAVRLESRNRNKRRSMHN